MGLLDIPAPVFQALDAPLAAVAPSGPRLVVWGALAGVLTMLLHWALSPQGRIADAKQRLASAQRALNDYDGEFAGAGPLIRTMLGQALRQVGLVVGPALAAGLPVLCLIVWLSTAYGHAYPPPAAPVDVRVTPPMLSAEWRNPVWDARNATADGPAEVVVTDDRGEAVDVLALDAPVPVLHKRAWWNALVANPAGYLPREGPTERIEIGLPRQEHFAAGPAWLRGWEAIFFASLILSAVAVKVIFRIK